MCGGGGGGAGGSKKQWASLDGDPLLACYMEGVGAKCMSVTALNLHALTFSKKSTSRLTKQIPNRETEMHVAARVGQKNDM